jgi:hypothetical protein
MSTSLPLRVLAIDPIPKGAAFAVFEGEWSLLDWGFKTGGNGRCQGFSERIQGLITRYEPDVMVLEDVEGKGSHRRLPAQRMIASLQKLANGNGLSCELLSRGDVRAAFPLGRQTKRGIAEEIALRFPELRETLPPTRKWFESGEDERMSVFDAAAMALALFASGEHR